MGYVYAVFGLGRQGTAAVYDLVVNCQADHVLSYEPDPEQRSRAKQRLRRLLGDDAPLTFDTPEATDWPALGQRAQALLSCAPYRFNPQITRHCVDVGLPICDLGGNPEVVARQERMADGQSVPVVPDCGLSPGMSNIAAVHLARRHGATHIQVRCGGVPLVPPDPAENPLQYKLVFDPNGLISEYDGQVPVIRNGRLDFVQACDHAESFDDGYECFPTSNNSPQVVEYLLECGVQSYDYKTVRYEGHLARVHGWRALGFLCGDAEKNQLLAELLRDVPALAYDPELDRDKIVLTVRGGRGNDGITDPIECRLNLTADEQTGFSAMELTTAWGGTVIAHCLAAGRGVPNGFATPERFVDTTWFLKEIDRRLPGKPAFASVT